MYYCRHGQSRQHVAREHFIVSDLGCQHCEPVCTLCHAAHQYDTRSRRRTSHESTHASMRVHVHTRYIISPIGLINITRGRQNSITSPAAVQQLMN